MRSYSAKLVSAGQYIPNQDRMENRFTSVPRLSNGPIISNFYGQQPDLTLDASKEFDVTLMLRKPCLNYSDMRMDQEDRSSTEDSDDTQKTLLSSRKDMGLYI